MTERLSTAQFIALNPTTGKPLVGGKLYTYAEGTTTPKDAYIDEGATVVHANPIILGAQGNAVVWLDGRYDLAVYDSNDVLVQTFAGVEGPLSAAAIQTLIDDGIAASALGYNRVAITTTTTLTATASAKLFEVDATAGDIVITLPGAAGFLSSPGFTIHRTDNSANTVTLVGNGAELIDGLASLTIPTNNRLALRSNGSQFVRVVPLSSSFGRSLMVQADAAAALNLLGAEPARIGWEEIQIFEADGVVDRMVLDAFDESLYHAYRIEFYKWAILFGSFGGVTYGFFSQDGGVTRMTDAVVQSASQAQSSEDFVGSNDSQITTFSHPASTGGGNFFTVFDGSSGTSSPNGAGACGMMRLWNMQDAVLPVAFTIEMVEHHESVAAGAARETYVETKKTGAFISPRDVNALILSSSTDAVAGNGNGPFRAGGVAVLSGLRK